MKKCNKCGVLKILGDFPAYRKRNVLTHLGDCRVCRNLQQKEVYQANRDDRLQRMRKYNEVRREENRIRSKEYYHENKDKQIQYRQINKEQIAINSRARSLRVKYGITLVDYEKMLLSQNGKCKICETDKPWSRSNFFHVDHCHRTGKVRGLLCSRCNLGIGKFEDNPILLRRVADYLEESNQ